MQRNDIIDNRTTKLIDHLRTIMDSCESAKFAVGYFFLSGLEGIADRLEQMKELRLLIGNTTNRETLEQLAEGYRRLDLVQEDLERQSYRRRSDAQQMAQGTVENVRESIEAGDQSDEQEQTIRTLVRLIEEKRVRVRVYTKGRLHAKAYIFDYGAVYDLYGKVKDREEKGIAVVGSSNLTLSGVTNNTELNVVVHGNNNHEALTAWFDELWEESEDFDEKLLLEIRQSWALAEVTPYELYLKTLFRLVGDKLDDDDKQITLGSKIEARLADFQKTAVSRVSKMIRDHGGGFVADVVGLGKSFIGAAIVKRFEQHGAKPMIICPAPLVEMWDTYNEEYELNARVVSLGNVSRAEWADEHLNPDTGKYRERDFILIDESHNFRTSEANRYQAVQRFLETGGKQVCLLTATPRNSSAWDVYNQIKLFHPDDKTTMQIDPPDLKSFFTRVESGEKRLQDVLQHVLYRRRRNDIIRWYGYDEVTNEPMTEKTFGDYRRGERRAYVKVADRHQYFPQRHLQTIRYSIEETYSGLYDKIRNCLGRDRKLKANPATIDDELTYARYGLWNYVLPQKQQQDRYKALQSAGKSLRGLVRVLMFKRFESSVQAFRCSVERMIRIHKAFLAAMDAGIVPAGKEAQSILYHSDADDEEGMLEDLKDLETRYDLVDFDGKRLRSDIEHDIGILIKLRDMVEPITADQDDKLQVLRKTMTTEIGDAKCLIFTQYADTAQYIYENLVKDVGEEYIDAVFAANKSKLSVVARFAPKANPELRRHAKGPELRVVVSTDVLSEGLNLQDGDRIINYDLHWNPVRLIQRFGRIDRIGSEHEQIYGYNFLPETGIEQNLGLEQVLRDRIREIHDTIGEDSKILDPSEQLNEDAMYAIYEGNAIVLDEHEADDTAGPSTLSEAEELLRELKERDPTLYQRIAALRDGVRCARRSGAEGLVVFCEAAAPGETGRTYQQLFHVTESGEVITRDMGRILTLLSCKPDEPGVKLPATHNSAVMKVRRLFAEEVKHREAELGHGVSRSPAQRFILRELQARFSGIEDETEKGQINLLEQAFRGTVSNAIRRELNHLRRDGIVGPALVNALKLIYRRHGMGRRMSREFEQTTTVPKVICSEALAPHVGALSIA